MIIEKKIYIENSKNRNEIKPQNSDSNDGSESQSKLYSTNEIKEKEIKNILSQHESESKKESPKDEINLKIKKRIKIKHEIDSDSNSENYDIKKKGNKRKRIKKIILKSLPLDDTEKKEIFDNNNINKISIIKTVETNKCKIKTKYLFSSESKNFIYYYCYKKKYSCKGTAKIDKVNKDFNITCYCDYKISHLNISYKDFIGMMITKKYNEINHKEIYVQKYFVNYQINEKNIKDYATINKNYVDIFGDNLNLTKSQFSKIKNKFNDEYKNLDIIQLIEKIKTNIPDLYIKIYDIKYEIIIKNKKNNRDNRLIFFGINKNLELITPNHTVEFFMDTTFKIIPVEFRPYKLFIISGIIKIEKKPKIFSMIMTKFTDNITYSHIFDYLFLNFGFKPKLIHSDYEASLALAINENKNIADDIIHTRCFFHYSQMVKRNLSKTGIFKKKMNTLSIEIISNIELLCFLNEENIDEFQKIIIKKLNSYKKLNSFVNYLKNYLFKLSPKIYNYSKLIEHFKNNNNNNNFLEKLYTTNNICESINSKISFNLPKKQTNNFNFVSALSNILSNELIDANKKIYRKDYKTKCLLKIISDLDLNNTLTWISYDIIKKNLKEVINNKYEEISENDIQKYINYIIEEDDENNGDIEKNIENKNQNINSESDENGSENIKEEKNNIEDQKNNSIDIEEENNESKNINLDNESGEDIDIINKVSDDYDKLIKKFDSLDIKDDENNSSWFKMPIQERIKLREKKEEANKANKKKDNKKKYNYPKD